MTTSEDTWHGEEIASSGTWANTSPERPNIYRIHEKYLEDHDHKGYVVYRLEDNDKETFNPRYRCKKWSQVCAIVYTLLTCNYVHINVH